MPGFDLSGVVTAVGSAVTLFKEGDAVMAQNSAGGAYAELVSAPDSVVSLKPDNITFAEAAAVPLAAQTALGALEKAAVKEGDNVVVLGASGGVGSFAVQIAKLLGAARVVGVCSAKNAEFVKSMGADEVVDYTSQKVGEALQKEYDVVFDTVGGKDQWDEAQKVLKAGGRFVTITGDDASSKVTAGSVFSAMSALAGRKLSGVFSSQHHSYDLFLLQPDARRWLDRIAEWLKAGKLKVQLDKRFEFSADGAQQMYGYNSAGRTVGKTVMEIVKEGESQAAQPSSSSSASTTGTATEQSSSSSSSSSSAAAFTTSEPAAAATASSADGVVTTTVTTRSAADDSSSGQPVADHAAHSTQTAVSVAGGGVGGSVEGTVGDLPTAPHTDVSTGSIE